MAICMEQVRLYLPTVLGDQDFFLHDHQPVCTVSGPPLASPACVVHVLYYNMRTINKPHLPVNLDVV